MGPISRWWSGSDQNPCNLDKAPKILPLQDMSKYKKLVETSRLEDFASWSIGDQRLIQLQLLPIWDLMNDWLTINVLKILQKIPTFD